MGESSTPRTAVGADDLVESAIAGDRRALARLGKPSLAAVNGHALGAGAGKPFRVLVAQAPEKQNILMLGGGTLTLPQALATQYPDSQVDVVEIDPELFELARARFFYNDPANVELIAADARRYVETTNKKYDVVLVDVYQDGQMPFTTTTHQFAAKLSERLNPDGVVALNLIAAQSGACGDLLAAVNQSFETALGAGKFNFQQPGQMSNLIAAYGKTGNLPDSYQALELATKVKLTDNFAPTDQLTSQCQNS